MLRTMTLTAALAIAAAPAAAQNIADEFRCAGTDGGPDVLAVVGRTDLLSELAGRDMDPRDVTILHVQMVADEPGAPVLPHLAVTEAALAECQRADPTAPFDRNAFAEGLDAFQAMVRDETATIIETDPAGAYRAAVAAQQEG
jgi:hypothetical protein